MLMNAACTWTLVNNNVRTRREGIGVPASMDSNSRMTFVCKVGPIIYVMNTHVSNLDKHTHYIINMYFIYQPIFILMRFRQKSVLLGQCVEIVSSKILLIHTIFAEENDCTLVCEVGCVKRNDIYMCVCNSGYTLRPDGLTCEGTIEY